MRTAVEALVLLLLVASTVRAQPAVAANAADDEEGVAAERAEAEPEHQPAADSEGDEARQSPEPTRPRATLSYAADPSCPDEQSFRDGVASRLGYDPFVLESPTAIEVRLEGAEPAEASGSLVAVGAGDRELGRREIAGPSCDEVATTLAIGATLLLDPLGLTAAVETEPRSETPVVIISGAQATDSELPPVMSVPEDPAPESDDGLRFAVGTSLRTTAGLAPGPTVGPSLWVALGGERWSVELVGRVDIMPGAATSDEGDELEATIFSSTARGCYRLAVVLGCVGAGLGAFQGRGLNVVDPAPVTTLFGTVEAEAGVEAPLASWLRFRATVALLVPLVRTSLRVTGATVWTAPPVAGGLDAGLRALF